VHDERRALDVGYRIEPFDAPAVGRPSVQGLEVFLDLFP